jgi:threonine dehydrogenase-like Zn-dependent dehydrogenase
MKAFVMLGIGKVGIVDKPIPEPGPNDVILKTTSALICTSDVHTVGGAIGDRKNLTLGHEAGGIVYKIGSAVTGFKEGDRCVVCAITPCYKCQNCLRGFPSQCGEACGGWKYANIKDGSFAEYFHVNDAIANLVKVPDDVSDEAALYTTDMMATGFMGAEHGNTPLGGSVAVFGQGPVGLMATAGARLLGAGLIIAVESVPKRQELAKYYGADVIVDFSKVDAVAEIKRLTGGEGVDTAIEALGMQSTFENCVKATRPGGTISNCGFHGKGEYVKIPRVEWGYGMADKTIRTGLCPGGSERMGRLLRLIQAGRIDPTKLTTHRMPFSDIEKGFRIMANKEDGVIKPMILFS